MFKITKNRHKWSVVDIDNKIISIFITKQSAQKFIKINSNPKFIKKNTTIFFN